MKALLKVSLMALTCGVMFGCAGSWARGDGRSEFPTPNRLTSAAQNTKPQNAVIGTVPVHSSKAAVHTHERKPVVFRSLLAGFEFEVPPGWEISTSPISDTQSMVLVTPRPAGLADGFYLWKCPAPGPKGCMEKDYMPANLVKVADVQITGLPAKEFTYDRQTVSRTRVWKEVVTVLNVKGRTYGIVVRIPHGGVEQEYLSLYQQIRNSFRLTDNP